MTGRLDGHLKLRPRLPAQFWHRAGIRAGLLYGAAVGRPIEVAGARMDPVMSALVRFVRKMHGGGDAGAGAGAAAGGGLHGLRALRAQYEKAPGLMGLHPDPEVTPRAVDGLPGALEYAFRGPGEEPQGTLLYLHGGGFMMGSPATHDALCRRLARRGGVRVVNAPYRLAPEHPFPAAHDDAAAAWGWVRANRPGPHLAGGDSAGANLAAGLPGAAMTVLLYPVVDMIEDETLYPSIGLFGEGFLLTRQGMEECARLLVPPGTDRTDARLSPLRGDLSRAAPTVVCVAGFDPLRDQGRAWVAAVRAAGQQAELLEEAGLVHGFADFAGVVPAARRAVDRVAEAVRAGVAGLA